MNHCKKHNIIFKGRVCPECIRESNKKNELIKKFNKGVGQAEKLHKIIQTNYNKLNKE